MSAFVTNNLPLPISRVLFLLEKIGALNTNVMGWLVAAIGLDFLGNGKRRKK